MITKQLIESWISEDFDILQNGKPIKVTGNIWDYINTIDATKNNILVLREIIHWEEDELAKII